MLIIDLFLMIADFFEDIRNGKTYGFCSFLWKIATFVCLFFAALFFCVSWKVPGILAILSAVICLVCSCCRAWRDIRKKRSESTADRN